VHLVCDNYATHKTPAVKRWLAKNTRLPRDNQGESQRQSG
jgi:hypothetical protein